METVNPPTGGPGLLTDRYELTMLASFIADGSAGRKAVFEAFARRLPEGRRYGIAAGLGRLVELVEGFRFDASEIAWLRREGVVDAATADYLATFRFRGTIEAIPEGDLYFPGTPVLTVSGTLGECIVLETLVLSVLNHDSAIASTAARMVTAAGGRPEDGGRAVIEMGSRRTHEEAAVATARAAYLAGFASTSNLAAGYRHGIPTVGTAAHAFTLAHDSELAAFANQVEAHGTGTTLLVDTYDIPTGIRNAVTAAAAHGATGPGAIRIDSGDLAEEAAKARALLDDLGATSTRITVTSDLDEYVITALQDAPIDGYGAGTRVATGSGHPTAGMVYKLVAIEQEDGTMRPVAKKARDKASVGGRKRVYRSTRDGILAAEVHVVAGPPPDGFAPAQVTVVDHGTVVHRPALVETRQACASALASLPAEARSVTDGVAWLTPVVLTPATQGA
ncbi:nicotinate phosphoribosyltransferase [Nocardioides jiangxiensis]|uniref:Nicotinate phosphoribosyltransferase n=1 Tax=Nocardioides jiangxiensis TaxID=3064524 RepID=A0ABT9B094_9ACTN|nr:nicotinate phosphoribosyltransferase [Nocardioides sp. WY-20]MDO7868147.1 nicotinate phosphoribosyltransferase [Nocardioides sp. WY-20]